MTPKLLLVPVLHNWPLPPTGPGVVALAGQETLGLAHPVGSIRQLKSVAHSCRAVERQPEIPQRLSRPVGKRSAIEAPDGMRQRGGGGLEMTLHADL